MARLGRRRSCTCRGDVSTVTPIGRPRHELAPCGFFLATAVANDQVVRGAIARVDEVEHDLAGGTEIVLGSNLNSVIVHLERAAEASSCRRIQIEAPQPTARAITISSWYATPHIGSQTGKTYDVAEKCQFSVTAATPTWCWS